jgi:hypothetical protein
MISRLDTLHSLKIHTDGVSATVIGGADGYDLQLNPEIRQEATSGYAWSTFQALYNLAPMMRFNTFQATRILGAVGASGLAIASTTNAGLVAYGHQKQEGGTRKTGNVHISETVREGLLLLRNLTCAHNQDLTVSAEALVTYDGTNALVTQSSLATLPVVPIDDQRFGLGPIVLGTSGGDQVTIDQVLNVEIELGLEAEALSADGDAFPTMATINKAARPMMRITTLKSNLLSSSGVPLTGKDISDGGTTIYFRRRMRLSATGYEADNENKHICVTPVAGCAYHTSITRSANANGQAIIEIPIIGDAESFPLAFTTNTSIS